MIHSGAVTQEKRRAIKLHGELSKELTAVERLVRTVDVVVCNVPGTASKSTVRLVTLVHDRPEQSFSAAAVNGRLFLETIAC